MAYRKQELFATGPSEKDGLSKEIERMHNPYKDTHWKRKYLSLYIVAGDETEVEWRRPLRGIRTAGQLSVVVVWRMRLRV